MYCPVEVVIKEGTDAPDLNEEYFTYDGQCFVRPLQDEHLAIIEEILRILAMNDQGLML
jgi:hypothetical protein